MNSIQQGGEQEVNINNPYQMVFMKKTNDVDSIKLEKRTLEENFKNINEVRTGQRDHVSSGSGNGRVNINLEKVNEEDPSLTQKEKVEREKRDKELNEHNALRKKLDVEEVEARI